MSKQPSSHLFVDPEAEAEYPPNTFPKYVTKLTPPGGRPFKATLSPKLVKHLELTKDNNDEKIRPFGSGEETTEAQKYRRFLEIKDEIRKRARGIERSKRKAASIKQAAIPSNLPPLTFSEIAALFANSAELHGLLAVIFLNITFFLDLKWAVQTVTVVHSALLIFWVTIYWHAYKTSKRLQKYADLSLYLTTVPLLSLIFYVIFTDFRRWQWWDTVPTLLIICSPPCLHMIAKHQLKDLTPRNMGNIHHQTHVPEGKTKEIDLEEVDRILRKLRIRNQRRLKSGKATVSIKTRRDSKVRESYAQKKMG